MELKFDQRKSDTEANLIPLINIVFLILIFFLIATIIRPFSAGEIALATAKGDEELTRLSQTVEIDRQGTITVNGTPTSLEELAQQAAPPGKTSTPHKVDVIADKELPADKLLEIVAKIPASKSTEIRLLIERTKP